MGRIIAVVGNTGADKTTLVRALGRTGSSTTVLNNMPRALFKNDPRYALANPMDYMLQRAKQEQGFRSMDGIASVDGGPDLDFHGFTQVCLTRELLSDKEFQLCEALFDFFRTCLPSPLTARPTSN